MREKEGIRLIPMEEPPGADQRHLTNEENYGNASCRVRRGTGHVGSGMRLPSRSYGARMVPNLYNLKGNRIGQALPEHERKSPCQ